MAPVADTGAFKVTVLVSYWDIDESHNPYVDG